MIENSTGTAEGHFKFDGIPWSPKLDTIAGNYAINFRKGTIAKGGYRRGRSAFIFRIDAIAL